MAQIDDDVRLYMSLAGTSGTTDAHHAQIELARGGNKYSLEHAARSMKAVKYFAPNQRDFIYQFKDSSTLYVFEEGDMAMVQDHDVSNLREVDLFVWKVRR